MSLATRRAPSRAPAETSPGSNACPQTAALERLADVGEQLIQRFDAMAAAGEHDAPSIVDRFAKAADALSELGAAQKKFCGFIIGNRLKLAASVPIVLTLIGAISPNAAHVIDLLLKAWGVQ